MPVCLNFYNPTVLPAAIHLPLHRGGKNSHRRGFAAPPPSVREASCNHSRKEGCLPPAPHIRAYLRLRGKVSRRVLYCCEIAAARKTAHKSVSDCGVFLKLTTFSFISLKEKV